MVGNTRRLGESVLVLLAILCLALLLSGLCIAQEEEPTINEEYIVTINAVGDGHIVDTIEYSEADYEEIRNVANESRGFLTRRFTTDDNTGEVVDFKTDLDDKNHSVVITYDKPGYAYSQKGEFVIYGFSEKPTEESGNTFTFEEKSTINSEFTLFTDQVILSKTTIELPKDARKARFDQEDEAIKYQMPPASTQMGFFSENKTLLSFLFGLCTLLFSAALILVLTRKTAAVPAAAAPGVGKLVTEEPAAKPAEQVQEGAIKPARAEPRFCRKCGEPLSPGKNFCTKCGTHV